MQGTSRKRRCGYTWMRIGYASPGFSAAILIVALSVMVVLGIWAFREIPDTKWRWGVFLGIYSIATLIYTNLCVWLHEQLHCLAFLGTTPEHRTHIIFRRRYILFLNGHYRVRGPIDYRSARRALLVPLVLSAGLAVVGLAGDLMLPGWWTPVLLTMATAGVIDMTHDLYMVSQIRGIGEKGKYWDTGRELEAVWKEAV